MTLTERQSQFTVALAKLILFIKASGYGVKICELNRTLETQKRYVAEGRSKTLNSRHLDNLAVDLALIKDGVVLTSGEEFRPFGEHWESLGGRWGGRFGLEDKLKSVQATKLGWDSPHFEFKII